MKDILPTLLATLTGHPRYRPDFEWSTKSWTHNAFRFYELVFGRRVGLKLEMSAQISKGKTYYACHSWESVFALTEHYIRDFRLVPFKVYVPILVTPQGLPVFASPYLFAIALDNHAITAYSGAGTVSTAYTATGSNLVMVSGVWRAGGTTAAANPTYNSVAFTNAGIDVSSTGSNQSVTTAVLVAPATGSNTYACGSTQIIAAIVTLSGAKQSGQPDAAIKVNNEGSEINTTLSITTVANNAMAVAFYANSTATTPSAGTGSVQLNIDAGGNQYSSYYSGSTPITPAGPYSMTINHNADTRNQLAIVSIAPFAAAATFTPRRALMGVGL